MKPESGPHTCMHKTLLFTPVSMAAEGSSQLPSSCSSLTLNGALNEAHYPVAQPPKLKSHWGSPEGPERVSIMGLQPGVRGGGRASITALGDVMSRWPGATKETCPTLQQSQLSYQVHLSPSISPKPGGHTGLVKQREEEEEEW
ncbi:Hypothetical predicted protein [Xyrichtys novacula]|uniref:Prolactin receptor n=1 Tax=Xyrichtys novacula TaxID=13765 RepID=A0AAV1F0J6_XYRNO|nr:Hypothetical predicted protein [Xyrichtys novacula]